MNYRHDFESLEYMLENTVYFSLSDGKPKNSPDVVITELIPFKGNFTGSKDVDNFKQANELMWLEEDARTAKKMYILWTPHMRTVQIAYALMRGWCPSGASLVKLVFDKNNLVPLIEPRK